MRLLPTASAIERAIECPASCVLPAINISGDDATRGREIHAFIRRIANRMAREEALSLVPSEHRQVCEGIDLARIFGGLSDVRGEVAYAIDIRDTKVEELGINLSRNYPALGVNEFAGTNDIEGTRLDGVPVVCDVKTGFLEVTQTKDNAQQKFHARARQLMTGADEVEARLIFIGSDGRVTLDCHTFDSFELESFDDELIELRDRILVAKDRYDIAGEVSVSSGSWCRYCPAMAACPAYTALARTMADDVATIGEQLAAMTPSQQGVALVKAKEIEKLLESVLEGLKALARQNPIPLPNGKIYTETNSHATSFDQASAVAMLRTLGAADAEVETLYRRIETHPVKTVNDPSQPKRKTKTRAA